MNHIILTGATGFIGRYVLKRLTEDGFFVTAVIRDETKTDGVLKFIGSNTASEKRICFLVSDMDDISSLKFKENHYDAWIHLAWGGVNREQIDDENVQRKNFYNSLECLKKSHSLGCKTFIESGSRAEFGKEAKVIPEDMTGKPMNAYGKYKKEFYKKAYDYCNSVNMSYYHLRLFSVIGPGDHPWSLMSECSRKFYYNESMKFGSCRQMWNYIDVRDASKIIADFSLKIKNPDDNGIYNIANPESKRLIDYIYLIHDVTESDSAMEFSDIAGFDSFPVTEKMKGVYENYSFIDTGQTISDIIEVYKADKE